MVRWRLRGSYSSCARGGRQTLPPAHVTELYKFRKSYYFSNVDSTILWCVFLIHTWMPGTTSWTRRSESTTLTTSSSLSQSPGRSLASGSSSGSPTLRVGTIGSTSEYFLAFSSKLTSYLQVRPCLPQLCPRPGKCLIMWHYCLWAFLLGDLSCRLLWLAVRTTLDWTKKWLRI